jgi:hypothetical protein
MIAPDTLITELLGCVRRDLYGSCPDKWFSQQEVIKRALTFPAAWLARRHVEIPAARYQAILEGIIDGIVKQGDLSKVTFMGRYFYHCVQQHMWHHGDEYYREGVKISNRITVAMTAVERAHKGQDGTVPAFSQAHQVLAGRRKLPAHMRPAADPLQPDLFASAKPRRKR